MRFLTLRAAVAVNPLVGQCSTALSAVAHCFSHFSDRHHCTHVVHDRASFVCRRLALFFCFLSTLSHHTKQPPCTAKPMHKVVLNNVDHAARTP